MKKSLMFFTLIFLGFFIVSCDFLDAINGEDNNAIVNGTADDGTTDDGTTDDGTTDDGTTDDGTTNDGTTEPVYSFIFNSSGDVADITSTRAEWGSGSQFTDISDDIDFGNVIKVEPGSGWGASASCIAYTGLTDYQNLYNGISFKIKSSDLSSIYVKIPEVEINHSFSNATALNNGWYEVNVDFSDYSNTLATTSEIGIHSGYGNGGVFYITDIKMYSSSNQSSDNSDDNNIVDVGNDLYQPGDGWALAWSDEFDDGIFDDSVWTRQEMMDPYNGELQQYLNNSSVAYEEDDCMVLKASWYGGSYSSYDSYSSARIISNPGGQYGNDSSVTGRTFKYGKIAARIKLPGGKGIWPAFWMLGDNISETGGDTNWPQCGEIDILETGAGGDPNYGQGTVHGTVHRDPGTEVSPVGYNEYISAGSYTLANNDFFKDDFHVFEVEWDSSKIVWKLDGIEFGSKDISSDIENEFHKSFYLLFNIAVGGNFTDTPDSNTSFPQYMYIDWVRHYTK